jgi:hypothetical protein
MPRQPALSPPRTREAQTEPHLLPLRRRRRPLSPVPFSRTSDPESGRTPPRVRSAALVTAPVELR